MLPTLAQTLISRKTGYYHTLYIFYVCMSFSSFTAVIGFESLTTLLTLVIHYSRPTIFLL